MYDDTGSRLVHPNFAAIPKTAANILCRDRTNFGKKPRPGRAQVLLDCLAQRSWEKREGFTIQPVSQTERFGSSWNRYEITRCGVLQCRFYCFELETKQPSMCRLHWQSARLGIRLRHFSPGLDSRHSSTYSEQAVGAVSAKI